MADRNVDQPRPGSTEWRRQMHDQYADKLRQMVFAVRDLDKDVEVLDDDQLADLGIKRIAPLDVDEDTIGFEPLFFRPLCMSELEQLPHPLPSSHQWRPRCPGTDDDDDYSVWPSHMCEPENEAENRLLWCMGACPDLLKRHTEWAVDRIYVMDDDDTPRGIVHHGRGRYPISYMFQLLAGFGTTEESRWAPRLAASLFQTTETDGADALRSEIYSALTMLRSEAESGNVINHHTLPILVFSFHHDKTARICQFHFSGGELLMRQSRLLCLDGDEPTEDAKLIVRWMVNTPVGETAYIDLDDDTPEKTRNRREGSAEGVVLRA